VNDVVIKGNRLVDHGLGIDVMGPENARRSNWVVENNTSDVEVHVRPMRFFFIDGLAVRGNVQKVTNGAPGVVLNDVCGATVEGNDFGKGGIKQPGAPCNAALVVPVPPALPGRNPNGTGGPPPTSPPSSGPRSTTTRPGSTTPTTGAPTTSTPPAPGSESDGGSGFDLADGIFLALGALLALAIVLGLRARRPKVRPPR
jgi:hypothetical protein